MFKTKDGILNFAYSFGAAIVILGAFFKMTHTTFGGLINPNWVLGGALITEAIIFIVYAFNPPKTEETYACENVYPELLDKNAQPTPRQTTSLVQQTTELRELETSLSTKLDKMLADAKVDNTLLESFKTGIEKFSSSIDELQKSAEYSDKFNQELQQLTANLNNLNKVYAGMLSAMKS